MTKRQKWYLGIFSLCTEANLFLVYKIHETGNLRDSWEKNYVRQLQGWDIPLLMLLYFLIFAGCSWIAFCGWPRLVRGINFLNQKGNRKLLLKHGRWKIFGFIWCVWFFFFLVFYPGTAMNDTINILENPWKLSNQHPILYNLYTYGLFKLGNFIWNENFGLALISLIQMSLMAYVLSYAIHLLYEQGIMDWMCWLIIIYFSFAPVFSTYAFSAIKDTPFSIFLFGLVVLLYEAVRSPGTQCDRQGFWIKAGVCCLGIINFRSNGLFVVAGTVCMMLIVYRKKYKSILLMVLIVITISGATNALLKPAGVKKLFQESAGIPLQQIAAVVNKGTELTESQKEYLFRLLPEEKWSQYAPCCADNLKWDEDFDGQFLNETKRKLLSIWGELFVDNWKVYVEAYIMNTYGIWGIETRNKEQYYQKDIYPNTLNLYQKSPLPKGIRTIVYTYYCNRFTYRYLSAGTAFWVLFAESLWLLYQRKYRLAVVFSPIWLCFLSLMLATPIAFAFRYVFILAMVFPFCIVIPLIEGTKGYEERVIE